MNGTFEDSYKQLPQYCQAIQVTNPGSTAIVESTDTNQFRRVFICLRALAYRFKVLLFVNVLIVVLYTSSWT